MRLGAMILQTRSWAESRNAWLEAEALGVDVGYLADHLTHPTMDGQWLAEAWTTLAAAAEVTSRMEIGPLVASAAVRTPVALARAAATVQDISDGRLVLGVGAGAPFDALADRGDDVDARALADRFAETLAALVEIWGGASSYRGGTAAFDGVTTAPLPSGRRPPRLMVAAHGVRGYRLVAGYADAWSTYGGPTSLSLTGDNWWRLVESQCTGVAQACEAEQRDPTGLGRSLLVGVGAHRPLQSLQSFVETAERAASLGFDELVFYWPLGRSGDRFWADRGILDEAAPAAHEIPAG